MSNRMGLYEFKMLPESEQYSLLFSEGTFLANRMDGHRKLCLYSLGSFCAEITYDGESNQLISLITFRSKRLLEPYLSHIHLRIV